MKELIEKAWDNRELLNEAATRHAIEEAIAMLDSGRLRVAEPDTDGLWHVNQWVKKAVLLYFPLCGRYP